MRLRARVDANQPAIVEALRAVGCSVWVTSMVGHGAPDLVVWAPARAEHVLLELKLPREKLTPLEDTWHRAWKGPVYVVNSVDDALAAVNLEVVS